MANKNRWLVAALSATMHLSIGSVYAYSVLLDPLKQSLGWGAADVKWAFSLAIVFLGLSAAFLGPWIQKIGPRKAGMLCALLYGLGISGSGFAIHLASYPLFILTYGVIGGIGLGIGYLAPIPALVRWFPDKKGIGTGICVMGFGFAALVFGPLMTKLFAQLAGVLAIKDASPAALQTAISHTLMGLGAVYFTMIFSVAQYLAYPPENWTPKATGHNKSSQNTFEAEELTLAQASKTLPFYLMWGMFFLNIMCGISLISVAAKMAKEIVHFDPIQAAAVVGLLGLFNGAGRFFWAAVSDKIGRIWTYRAFYVIQLAIMGVLISHPDPSPYVFEALLCLWISCYGAGFSVLPAFLGELFGKKHLGSIQGTMLTAWSTAGLVGPWLITFVHDRTQSYASIFPVFAVLLVLALVLSIPMGRAVKKMEIQAA